MKPDTINGLFELCGGLLICLNIYRLVQDKRLRGVSWLPTAFFAAWGFWNLFYYPHLDQWMSFFGGVVVVTANTAWLLLVAYYARCGRK